MFRFCKMNINKTSEQLVDFIENNTIVDEELLLVIPTRGIHTRFNEKKNKVSMYHHSGTNDFLASKVCPFFYGSIKEKDGKVKLTGVITVSFFLHLLVIVSLVVFLIAEIFAIQNGNYVPLVIFSCFFVMYMVSAIFSWVKSSYDINKIEEYLKTLE